MSEKYGGHIEVIFGPMFSGKSTELLRKVKRYTVAQKKCLVIGYSKDNRYSDENVVSTHDKQMLKAVKCNRLDEVMNVYSEYDVIAVDEGQFFSDIVDKCEQFANEGKIVIVAALDATFQRKAFGDILNLLPIAEKVTKLSAVCVVCASDAAFTQRTTESNEIELIGGGELYRPVCRKCFIDGEKAKKNIIEKSPVKSSSIADEGLIVSPPRIKQSGSEVEEQQAPKLN